jgi:hypothetical protein
MHQYSSSSLFDSSYSSLFNLVLYLLASSTSMEKIRNYFDIIKG